MGCGESLPVMAEAAYVSPASLDEVKSALPDAIARQLFLGEFECSILLSIFHALASTEHADAVGDLISAHDVTAGALVDPSPFLMRMFVVSLPQRPVLNFVRFVLGVWQLCSVREADVGDMLHAVYDIGDSGTIDVHELLPLTREVFDACNNDAPVSSTCRSALRAVETQITKAEAGKAAVAMDLRAFNKFCVANNILKPVMEACRKLRALCGGRGVWQAVEDRRYAKTKLAKVWVAEIKGLRAKYAPVRPDAGGGGGRRSSAVGAEGATEAAVRSAERNKRRQSIESGTEFSTLPGANGGPPRRSSAVAPVVAATNITDSETDAAGGERGRRRSSVGKAPRRASNASAVDDSNATPSPAKPKQRRKSSVEIAREELEKIQAASRAAGNPLPTYTAELDAQEDIPEFLKEHAKPAGRRSSVGPAPASTKVKANMELVLHD